MTGDRANPSENSQSIYNVPNAITCTRCVLAIVMLLTLSQEAFLISFILFVVAAATDWFDGWWARRFNQITKFGRIFDSFVDKVLTCGAFIVLVGIDGSQVSAGLAIVVVCREMLISSVRGMVESSGGDFSAGIWGKLKFGIQCVAIGASLFGLSMQAMYPLTQTSLFSTWMPMLTWGAMVATVLITVYSAGDYCFRAVKILTADSEKQTREAGQ